ncbi:MAG: phage holin family protein [Intrasporangium sp.]|uniref:phage holin family protein n=1 Tax=Intrasporangium sp. TaxID=1925024 RepID=UPI00264892CF|nr:phage holin family protein [Intrasporangium sp.]MDN5797923.1 phage holin family protein [Intrasporangium sp.]
MSRTKAGQVRDERTLGQLVASLTQDVSTIMRGEIALVKAELTAQVKKAGKGGALLAVAGVIAFYSVYFIFITIAEGITAAGLPKWLSYLIVTLLFLITAAILAFLGIRRLKTVEPKPTRAVAEAEQTVAALKRAASNPSPPAGHGAVSSTASTSGGARPAAPGAPNRASGSQALQERVTAARAAESRAAAGASGATSSAPGNAPTSTTTPRDWQETATDALASDTGVEDPADLTDHPVRHSAPSASTAALPRTLAEAEAEEDAKRHRPEA